MRPVRLARPALPDVAAALAFTLLALLLQWVAGAYGVEMSRDADEAGHLVSGLLVRDYLVHGLGTSPLAYARDYYAHYPKVAIGNWPPLFHAVQGAWMAVFATSRASVLVLTALVAGGVALVTHRALRPAVGVPAAALGGATVLLLRPLPTYVTIVMAELPVTLACLLALLAWARFLASERGRDLALFAVLAVLAIMTKGNALFLAFVPPLSIALGGRWHLLRARALWIAAAIVALLTAPWIVYYLPTIRSGWTARSASMLDNVHDLLFFSRALLRAAGPFVLAVAALGLTVRLRRRDTGPAERALWVTAMAALVAFLAFFAVVPARLLDARHLLPIYPVVGMAVAAGAAAIAGWLARALPRWRIPPAVAVPVVILAVGAAVAQRLPTLRASRVDGFRAAAAVAAPTGTPVVALVASDAAGEGAFVVALALRDPARPTHVAWRASKLLAQATWAGRDYALRADDPDGVLALLDEADVDVVVLDRTRDSLPHQRLLAATIAARPARFAHRGALPLRRDAERHAHGLDVYGVVRPPGVAPDSVLRQVPGYEGVVRSRRPTTGGS